ncbi:MAG: hypothetical protein K5879_11680 [Lachnospiraceae bacterium]|nr:hypothetical protein [Lachnospiraceae bacterium]
MEDKKNLNNKNEFLNKNDKEDTGNPIYFNEDIKKESGTPVSPSEKKESKGKQTTVRINPEDKPAFDSLCEEYGLTQAEMLALCIDSLEQKNFLMVHPNHKARIDRFNSAIGIIKKEFELSVEETDGLKDSIRQNYEALFEKQEQEIHQNKIARQEAQDTLEVAIKERDDAKKKELEATALKEGLQKMLEKSEELLQEKDKSLSAYANREARFEESEKKYLELEKAYSSLKKEHASTIHKCELSEHDREAESRQYKIQIDSLSKEKEMALKLASDTKDQLSLANSRYDSMEKDKKALSDKNNALISENHKMDIRIKELEAVVNKKDLEIKALQEEFSSTVEAMNRQFDKELKEAISKAKNKQD